MKTLRRLARWWRLFKCRHGVHDYEDGSEVRTPAHFYEYTCRHCGGRYRI